MALQKHYEAIPVGQLEVDPILDTDKVFVQRSATAIDRKTGEVVNDAWTSKLVEEWDVEKLLPALVSKRVDGRYMIIDGQHSNEAAIQKEGPDFLRDCMVYEGLAPSQEAKLFLAANKDRKAVKPYENFRVSLTAGDPLALSVNAEVQSLGNDLQIAASPSANRVGAVQALLTMGKKPGMVTRVLSIVEKAWGRDTSTWDNIVLRAVAGVLDVPAPKSGPSNWDLADDARLIKVLKRGGTPAIWKRNAVKELASGGGSASRAYPMIQAIVNDYNAGLEREKMLLTPPKRGGAASAAA